MADAPKKTDWHLLALLRFFLAWVVLCGHLDAFAAAPIGWVRWFVAFGGKAAVIGFLLVSGYSIAASLERNQAEFYRRRFLRIYPVYFFVIVLASALELTVGHGADAELPAVVSGGHGWPTILGNVLLLQTFVVKPLAFDGPVWSLAIEAFYYLCAPWFARLRPRYLVALIVFSGVCSLLPRHEDWGLPYLVLSKLNALRFLWCWLLGFVMRRHGGTASAVLCALGIGLVAFNDDAYERWSVVTYVITAVIIAASTRVALPRAIHRVADYLGDFSYPMYLVHFPAFVFAIVHLGTRDVAPMLGLVAVGTLVAHHLIDGVIKPRFVTPWVMSIGRTLTASEEA